MKKNLLGELDVAVAKDAANARGVMPRKRKSKVTAGSASEQMSADVQEEDGYSAGIAQRWREQVEGDLQSENSKVTSTVEAVSIREGLKDEVLELLKQNLTIDVLEGNFTNPNQRTIEVKFDGVLVGSSSFYVVQKEEYEG